MGNFYLKTKVVWEEDLDKKIDEFDNERIWIACDKSVLENSLIIEMLNRFKQKNNIKLFSDIVPDPPLQKVQAGIKDYLNYKPSIVVAIGGGSAIDTAKTIRYFAEKMTNDKTKKCIAIPTTSGTGSEVTSVAVITDPEENVKYPIVSDWLIPTEAWLNEKLVLSCPKSVTANSGIDVLSHCLEALVAKNSNNFTDALAIEAGAIVFEYLQKCYDNGNNIYNRKQMHEASCMAGMAFQQAGLGLVHSISHQIGGIYHLPHGLINGILLPEVIKFNLRDSSAMEKYSKFSKRLNLANKDDSNEDAVNKLISNIKNLVKNLGAYNLLSETNISEASYIESFPRIIKQAREDFTYLGNPKEPTVEDFVQILISIF